jgi:hypothetical protein
MVGILIRYSCSATSSTVTSRELAKRQAEKLDLFDYTARNCDRRHSHCNGGCSWV